MIQLSTHGKYYLLIPVKINNPRLIFHIKRRVKYEKFEYEYIH